MITLETLGFQPITYRKDLSRYLINRKGEVFSLHSNRVIKGTNNGNGYILYNLTDDNGNHVRALAHILVANQYIPNDDPEHKTIVNHIDEDKKNPSVDNLEWVTPKQNTNHGTCRQRSGNSRKKPVAEYNLQGEFIRTWKSVRDIATFYADLWECDISAMKSVENTIYACCKNDTYTAYGRIWRYNETGSVARINVRSCVMRRKNTSDKLTLFYNGKVPEKYLYQEPTDKEIYDYFMSLDKLTEREKMLIRKLARGTKWR